MGGQITAVNSGQDGEYWKQCVFLAPYQGLLEILKNPYGSIYTPVDIHEAVLSFLDDVINKWGNGSVPLKMPDRNGLVDAYVLAAINHLTASVNVSTPTGLLDGLETVITRSCVVNGANPLYLDTKLLEVLRVDSANYAKKVEAGGFFNWCEENKQLLAFLAQMVNTAAFVAIGYASMRAAENSQSYTRSNPDVLEGEIGQANNGEGGTGNGLPANRQALNDNLTGRGFNCKGQTQGGYVEYAHPDGTKVWVRPDGEVLTIKREWLPDMSRKVNNYYQWDGTLAPPTIEGTLSGHNTGEFVEPITGGSFVPPKR